MSPTDTANQAQPAADRRFGRKVALSFGRGTVSLTPALVERLVAALREEAPDGEAVADEISLLATAGIGVDLRLSAPELRALASAIGRMSPPSRPRDPSLTRLLEHLREQQLA